jgi:HK97 family phage prohead protease
VIELREDRDFWSLAGNATTYNASYWVGHGDGGLPFRETIMPGAFTESATKGHVELRILHDQRGPVLADTTSRTMRFRELADSLALGAALSKSDRNAASAVERVRSGELHSFSVGFRKEVDHWPAPNQRHIYKAELREVSLVSSPCNPQAVVTALRMDETRSSDSGLEYRMVPITFRDNDGDEVPPHLRLAGFGAAERCDTRAAYDGARCRMFDEYKVQADEVCDDWTTSWPPDDGDADDWGDGDRAELLPNDTGELLAALWATSKDRTRMEPNDTADLLRRLWERA